MDSYEGLPDETEHELSQDEAELRELEARLQKFKKPKSNSSNRTFARGIALVTSMGFILAGCLIAGLLVGEWAVERTGYQIFQLLGLLLGLVAAIFSGAKLMKPFLKSDE